MGGIETVEAPHVCHARRCQRKVPPRLFMCRQHWHLVPSELQRQVWKHYRPGQEIDKNPTDDYLLVSRRAIDAVEKIEADNRASNGQKELFA